MTITRRQADYCVRVVYASDSPSGREVSARLLSSRPITHSKDILLRKYKVSDTHVTIWDEEGYFLTGGANSIVDDVAGRPDWYGRQCTITLQESAGGPDLFTFVGFMIGLDAEAGKATLRLTSRFQRLLMRPFLANDAGKMVDAEGETGVAGDPPTAGPYLSDITPNAAAGCLVETWTFTFISPTEFSVQGSQTGDDGRGTTGVNFTSDSGRITVLAADWNIIVAPFVAGDQCSIKTVYRYAATTTVAAFQETLTNALAGGLLAADIHPSLATFVGTIVDQRLGPFGLVIDDQMTVLRALEMISLHMLAVAVEFTDARIGMYAYVPTMTTADTIFCKGTDLIKAMIGHTPVYNVFNYEHTYIEKDEEYDGLETFPDTDADNESFLKYGVKLEAPQQPKLKGFAEGNVSWIRSLARQNYERWAWPRRIFKLDLKVSRMTIEMNELYELQSSNPTVDVVGIEPSKISRSISPALGLSGEFFDASFYLQLEGACGYAFTEQGHLMDNCWVVF